MKVEIVRLGIVCHFHWWSEWKDVYTGGPFGSLRAKITNGILQPIQERHCRCGEKQAR